MGQVNELKDFTRGQLDAALMKIGQDVGMDTAEGINAFLRGDLVLSERTARLWREKKGVISFSVKSDGTNGEQWITRLKSKRFHLEHYAPDMLRSPDFNPTSGVTTRIAVLKGILFESCHLLLGSNFTNNIYTEAERRNLSKPNAEIACLIREKFTDDEMRAMGLGHIVVMHDQFKGFASAPAFLSVSMGRGLRGYFQQDGSGWYQSDGCAFVVSSSSAESLADK